jgi:hypothetical protein
LCGQQPGEFGGRPFHRTSAISQLPAQPVGIGISHVPGKQLIANYNQFNCYHHKPTPVQEFDRIKKEINTCRGISTNKEVPEKRFIKLFQWLLFSLTALLAIFGIIS